VWWRQPACGVLDDLRDHLVGWEERSGGDAVDAHRQRVMARYLEGLRELLRDEPSRERAALLAALALGPRGHGLPRAADIGPLVRLAVETPADVVDLAIAWGAGWGRSVRPDGRWQARWTGSVLALACLVRGSINRTVGWLAANVADFRQVLRHGGEQEHRDRLDGLADTVALELATGRCRCGHGNLRAHSPIGSCARPEHRLESWLPDRCRLHAFVAVAVRGSARLPVRAGAFEPSMLAGVLESEQLLRVGVAEFSVCHECNGRAIALAVQDRARIQLTGLERGLYDIAHCPSCGVPAHPRRTYRAARKNWLLVPAEWGGTYHPVHRHRCMVCGNLVASGRCRCPICGWSVPVSPRPTTVWRRLAGPRPLVA
jgi:hypothetical protein